MSSSKNNPISQVLATSGNQSPLAINLPITSLGVGQIGAFSKQNNLSLSVASNVALAREFYLAVGVDRDSNTVLDDIVKSAGQYIRLSEIEHITLRCYSPGQPKIVDITDFTSKCDTEYGLRIHFNNQRAQLAYGFNLPSKYFHTVTGCCDNCADPCTDGNCNQLAYNLVHAINNDPDGLLVASYVDYTTTPGTNIAVPESGYAAWIADVANVNLCLGIRLTTVNSAVAKFIAGINQNYQYPRFTNIDVSLSGGFECENGTVTVAQEIIPQQGAGYDLRQQESDASGNTETGKGPYRQSALHGMPFDDYQPVVSATGEYLQYVLTYKQTSNNGGPINNNMANLETVVAIPCADTTTRTNFVALMDALTTGKFEQLATDNTACPACNQANIVSTLNSTANDGDA